jgi:putative phosphonate metabolism protein
MIRPSPRYALYWAPSAGSALAIFGAQWLGRDAETGAALASPLSVEDQALTADPRRYGLHATLKPPFALAADVTIDDLEQALVGFAASRAPVALGRLALTDLKGFLALCPPTRVPALHDLADACVRDFDRFRAPPSEAELAKRRAARLSSAQDTYLQAWGYPYVFDQFQFHVTLTERLDPATRARFEADLASRLPTVLAESQSIDDIALFEEPAAGAPFVIRRRFKLCGK